MPRQPSRWIALLPAVGVLGACIHVYSPRIRPVDHHAGMRVTTPNDTCMACHEAEQEAAARLQTLDATHRERALAAMANDGEASLVAQWMIEDSRTCATCHEPWRAR